MPSNMVCDTSTHVTPNPINGVVDENNFGLTKFLKYLKYVYGCESLLCTLSLVTEKICNIIILENDHQNIMYVSTSKGTNVAYLNL